MKEPGEKYIVVLALIVTELAIINMCMCVGGMGGCYSPPPFSPAGFVTIYTKTTVHCSPDSTLILCIPDSVQSVKNFDRLQFSILSTSLWQTLWPQPEVNGATLPPPPPPSPPAPCFENVA